MNNKKSMTTKMQQAKGFVAGLVVGSAIGGAAALLMAPRSGEETRKEIQEKAAAVQSRAGETVDSVREQVQETTQKVVQKAEAAQSRVQKMADNGKERIEEIKV